MCRTHAWKRLSSAALLAMVACGGEDRSTPPAAPPPYAGPPPYYPPNYPPPARPGPPNYPPYYPQAPAPPPPQPPMVRPSAPPPVAPIGGARRPLLPPLVGSVAWQNEVRAVLVELIARLPADRQARVRGIPLVFDPDPSDINAFAGCNDGGSPFLATTAGLLAAVDAVAQTKATDEMFGTQTYDTYTRTVLPNYLGTRDKGGRADLPPGSIPAPYVNDPRRLSRAHELFDDIVAFTFGHELGHHYLGHTGCANGQPPPGLVGAEQVQRALSRLNWINQFTEGQADEAGCLNVLETGKARLPNYRWSEKGGLILFDFFTRLERAAGTPGIVLPGVGFTSLLGAFSTHPQPSLRGVPIQWTASGWYRQNPGVGAPQGP